MIFMLRIMLNIYLHYITVLLTLIEKLNSEDGYKSTSNLLKTEVSLKRNTDLQPPTVYKR